MKRKLVVAGVAALAVLVVLLMVAGISGHREPSFIDHVPRWQREIPLKVSVSEHGGGDLLPRDGALVQQAVSEWNARVGLELFVLSTVDADIRVVMHAPAGDGWEPGGHSELVVRGGRAVGCDVRVSNVDGDGDVPLLVIEHELGHCLGLAHDDFDSSLMRPVQSPTPHGQFPPRITDADRSAIRERFGR